MKRERVRMTINYFRFHQPLLLISYLIEQNKICSIIFLIVFLHTKHFSRILSAAVAVEDLEYFVSFDI